MAVQERQQVWVQARVAGEVVTPAAAALVAVTRVESERLGGGTTKRAV